MKYLKILFVLILIGFFSANVAGQIITSEPDFATGYDSLIITYDATEGNGGLEGFTGDVYLHTGAITSESSDGSDWKYVPYGWDTHHESMKATPLGNDKWEFKYLPTVREFFGVTNSAEKVQQVAIVFKGVQNGSVVAEGKDVGNTDIFIDLATGEVNAKFLNPTGEFKILDKNESLEIVGIGTVNTGELQLILEKNGTEIAASTSDTLKYTFNPESGELDVTFNLIASNGAGFADTSSVFVTVKEEDGALQSRPTSLRDGITYMDFGIGEVALSLFAPEKEYLYVIGDFNNWTPSSEYLMKKDSLNADSVWHWLEFSVSPMEEYAFQYLIDGELRIADPYSELVLDPNNDQYISEETFPDLLEYPDGKTSGYVSVLQPNKQAFNWEATDYERPDKENLVIYELLLRDFLETSNYQTLTDSLDYLERLGVNAIELMPVNEFDGNLSWGYNPSFHLALDKYYGSPEAFKIFVDEAHKRGMAVILDVVLNHATGLNPLYQLYGGTNNPYFNATAKHDYNVFNDMNHEYSGTRYYSKRVMEYWLDEYNIDGYRFDLSKGFTQKNTLGNTGAWGQYDQSRVNIWKDYADHIWDRDSSAYVILEHFTENSEEKVLADYGMMLWGNMNHEYNEASMGYASNLEGVLAESRSFNDRHLVGYMESHDEQWLMFKNIAFGNSSGDYDITDFGTALGRQKLAGAFFFTLPGPKMMWQFGELGYGYGDNGEQCLNDADYCPSSAPGRTEEKPIRWDYYDHGGREKLYDTWSTLINLRQSSPAFTNPAAAEYKLAGSIKTISLEHSDSNVLIVGNFGVTDSTAEVVFPSSGTWYDFFGGTELTVSNPDREVELAPGLFKIFTTREFETPGGDLLTSSEPESNSGLPAEFKLGQNYPNPFNPTTVFTYDVAKTGLVKLEVFDVLGRKVAELVNQRKSPGSYTVHFDAGNLSSGMYIYRMQVQGKVFTQKMLLIK